MVTFDMNQGSSVQRPCDTDYVEITLPGDGTENVNIGKLCGENTGQHLYIHFPETVKEKSFKIKLMARTSSQYTIKIHQVSNSIVNKLSQKHRPTS